MVRDYAVSFLLVLWNYGVNTFQFVGQEELRQGAHFPLYSSDRASNIDENDNRSIISAGNLEGLDEYI